MPLIAEFAKLEDAVDPKLFAVATVPLFFKLLFNPSFLLLLEATLLLPLT